MNNSAKIKPLFKYKIVAYYSVCLGDNDRTLFREFVGDLSFADIEDELRNIKLSELELGHRMKKIMIPELNPIQKEVLEILKTKPEQIMTTM